MIEEITKCGCGHCGDGGIKSVSLLSKEEYAEFQKNPFTYPLPKGQLELMGKTSMNAAEAARVVRVMMTEGKVKIKNVDGIRTLNFGLDEKSKGFKNINRVFPLPSISKTKRSKMNIEKYQSRGIKFVVLATRNDEEVMYLQEEIDVVAKGWEDAYQQVRDMGFTPYSDVYQVTNK